ncbi:hypothetical protein [Shewanella sp.]|uniref:hypothetical protein n=1 Tax=Shewanella sp. TaxID=50422 RepID=UPI003A975F52
MNYKRVGGGIAVMVLGAIAWLWWYERPTSSAANEQTITSHSPTAFPDEQLAAAEPRVAVPQASTAKVLAEQCWQALDQQQQIPDPTAGKLFTVLIDALNNGASVQQLVLQTPSEESGTYLRQLMFAQRFQAYNELGYANEITEVDESDAQLSEYFKSLPEKERLMAQMEQVADKKFQQVVQRIEPLLSLDTQQFDEQLADVQLSSGDFVSMMLRGSVPPDKLAVLLDRIPAEQLAAQPLVTNFMSTTPFFNIADYAAYTLDVPLLALLAQHGVVPTQIDGLVGPIERALSHRRWGENDADNTLAAVQYLVENGYKIASTTDETGEKMGSRVFDIAWVALDERVKNYLLSQHATMPALAEPATMSDEVISDIIAERSALRQQYADNFAHCRSLDADLLSAELLWSPEQTNEQIKRLKEQYQGEALLDALQNREPQSVSIFRESFAHTPLKPSHYRELRQAMLQQDSVTALAELLQNTSLDAADTSIMLMQLPHNPELIPYWNSRVEPVAPSSIRAIDGVSATLLRDMIEQGFDLHQTDENNVNLYSVFFESAPELVELLLQARVDPFSNRYGPDALDYALDKSYIDGQLFPGTAEILRACVSLEPNHQRRFARLKQFRPDIYQQLLAIDPALQVSDEIKPNNLLSVRR